MAWASVQWLLTCTTSANQEGLEEAGCCDNSQHCRFWSMHLLCWGFGSLSMTVHVLLCYWEPILRVHIKELNIYSIQFRNQPADMCQLINRLPCKSVICSLNRDGRNFIAQSTMSIILLPFIESRMSYFAYSFAKIYMGCFTIRVHKYVSQRVKIEVPFLDFFSC